MKKSLTSGLIWSDVYHYTLRELSSVIVSKKLWKVLICYLFMACNWFKTRKIDYIKVEQKR